MDNLKTGELAKQAGVNIEALRFSERKGLLPQPPRRASGYREYPPESPRLIRFIKRAQKLGFSRVDIKELLALQVQAGTTCAAVKGRAEHKIQDVRQKISDLKAIERALSKVTVSCSGRGPLSGCTLLENRDGELSSGPNPSGNRRE